MRWLIMVLTAMTVATVLMVSAWLMAPDEGASLWPTPTLIPTASAHVVVQEVVVTPLPTCPSLVWTPTPVPPVGHLVAARHVDIGWTPTRAPGLYVGSLDDMAHLVMVCIDPTPTPMPTPRPTWTPVPTWEPTS